jgi:hypothetical protein
VFQRPNGYLPMKYDVNGPKPPGSYQAQISKTEDGGATWKTVFNVSNQFYVSHVYPCVFLPCAVVVCVACVVARVRSRASASLCVGRATVAVQRHRLPAEQPIVVLRGGRG